MTKAISYIRFSSTHQGRGSTTERQQGLIHDWLSRNPDITLSSLSQKDLGRSGYKGEHLNHGLGRILEGIEEGKIRRGDYILVEAVDRIGRLPMLDMLQLVQSIASAGVKIITLEDGAEYSDESLNNNPSSVYVLVGKIQQAGEYSRNLSRRLIASYDLKRRKARQGGEIFKSNPFWLDSQGKLIPERAEAVKACINLYLDGKGTRKILEELYDSHPSLRDKHPTTLKRWFRSRALVGEWETNHEIIRGVYTPLVDQRTYYALRDELVARRREMSPEQKYLLSGLVKCYRCGKRFHIRRKRYKETTILYANCSNYLKRGKTHCDNSATWPYEVLMEIFESTFHESVSNSARDAMLARRAERANSLRSEIEDINNIIESLINIVENSPNDIKSIGDRITSHNEKILKLESELAAIEVEDATLPDHLDFEDGEIAFGNETLARLFEDNDVLRKTLSRNNYFIAIDGKSAYVDMPATGIATFHLHKRSTKHKCYIMEAITPETIHYDLDDHPVTVEQCNMFLAIDRKGVICSANDNSQLLKDLSSNDSKREHETLFGEVLDINSSNNLSDFITAFQQSRDS